MHSAVQQVHQDGFTIVPAVFADVELTAIIDSLTEALAGPEAAVLQRDGRLCGARNLIQTWPQAAEVWRRDPLPALLRAILGDRFGLVRALYFDKPPGDTWALPWHKDLTIAVSDNRLPSSHFRRPTTKAGVPHVEASQALLETMLTARIHLDDATDSNGPMQVMPGSHQAGKTVEIDESLSRPLLAQRGDVLLIRPLVAHNSTSPHPSNQSHRRILHLEFATESNLPDGFTWHDFVPG